MCFLTLYVTPRIEYEVCLRHENSRSVYLYRASGKNVPSTLMSQNKYILLSSVYMIFI